MIVNQQALTDIYTGFKTIFPMVFTETKTLWEHIATKIPSETGDESYKWLGQMPKMREWIGDRQIQNLSAHDYTISVKKSDISDDKLGIYKPMMETMAQNAASFPDDLVFKLFKALRNNNHLKVSLGSLQSEHWKQVELHYLIKQGFIILFAVELTTTPPRLVPI